MVFSITKLFKDAKDKVNDMNALVAVPLSKFKVKKPYEHCQTYKLKEKFFIGQEMW